MTIVSMTGFAEAQGSHEGAALALGSQERQWPRPRSAPAHAAGLRRHGAAGAHAGGERFQRGSLPGRRSRSKPQDGARGLRVDPVALAAAVKIARKSPPRPGLAPARVDGLLALKGVIVQDEALPLDAMARGAARCRHPGKPGDGVRRAGQGARDEGAKLARAAGRADGRDRAPDGRSRHAWRRRSPQRCATG